MRKISLTLVICVACSGGIFFGVRQLTASKKTITLSISELNKSVEEDVNSQEIVIEKQKEVKSEQIIVENADEEKVENVQSASSVEAGKKEAVVEEKKQIITKNESQSAGDIVSKLVSWGFTKSTNRKIDTIIVHSSYDALGNDPYSVAGIIAEYKQYEVSAHYLIARDGTIYQLVGDQNIAWHAGVSSVPDGRKNVNDFSIGVELINTENGKYADKQYDALNSLMTVLKKKYEIKYILGHKEISPGRKTDPWNLDWDEVRK